MDTECNKVDAYLLAVFTDCNVGTVFHDFNTLEITNDYCSEEWADFAQMSVYGAIVGREEWERNNDIREYHIFMDALNGVRNV